MLERESDNVVRKTTGSCRTYSIPGKTASLVPEFVVEDLPSAELQRRLCVRSEGPALGQNTLMMNLQKGRFILGFRISGLICNGLRKIEYRIFLIHEDCRNMTYCIRLGSYPVSLRPLAL